MKSKVTNVSCAAVQAKKAKATANKERANKKLRALPSRKVAKTTAPQGKRNTKDKNKDDVLQALAPPKKHHRACCHSPPFRVVTLIFSTTAHASARAARPCLSATRN